MLSFLKSNKVHELTFFITQSLISTNSYSMTHSLLHPLIPHSLTHWLLLAQKFTHLFLFFNHSIIIIPPFINSDSHLLFDCYLLTNQWLLIHSSPNCEHLPYSLLLTILLIAFYSLTHSLKHTHLLTLSLNHSDSLTQTHSNSLTTITHPFTHLLLKFTSSTY